MPAPVPLHLIPVPPGQALAPYPALRRRGSWLAHASMGVLLLVSAFAATALALGLLCGGAFLWLAPGAAYIGLPPADVPGLVPFGDLPRPTRWAYAATFVLDTVPVLLVLVEMRALALTYAAGHAFTASGPRSLRRIGLWLVAYALAPAIGHALVVLAGHGVDLDWLHTSSLHALVLAAALLVFAEVLRIGRAVEQDRDGFV